MRRRDFLGVVGGAAATWPFTARAQQAKLPKLGILLVGNREPFSKLGLPPEKWSSLMYGLWPDGGLKNAKEETHG
jgi:hypothetical protein